MLRAWRRAGVLRVDLAVRRPNGAMIWHRDLPSDTLPLAWLRAENVRSAEVYARPARGYDWPLVFLDDLAVQLAERIARKYSALVVATSPQGGCHLWLTCALPLSEAERRTAQRWLAAHSGADARSASGEHLGRLAGFRNWKRGGTWVNVLTESVRRPWSPEPALLTQPSPDLTVVDPTPCPGPTDTSDSGRDWAWVCRALALGSDPETVCLHLAGAARPRRGADAVRYARVTITRALAHLRRR
jgi:hypothetical protein